MKIETIDITPLKMGRVKGTQTLRAIACRLTIKWDDRRVTHRHVDTMSGGIYQAYTVAQEMILANMKERGVA